MNAIDLLFIHPCGQKKIYQTLSGDLTALEPPLWALLGAGYAMRHGFSASILDAEAMEISPLETACRAKELAPKLIAIAVYGHNPSASTQMMPAVRAVCQSLKSVMPHTPVLLFGGHAAALPERTLTEEAADFVSSGEGLPTLCSLLGKIKAGDTFFENVPDLWYQKNGKTVSSKIHAPLTENLDAEIPELPWHLLPMERYRAHNWHCFGGLKRMPYASLYTTLGCPYHCEFCCIQAPFRSGEKASGIPDRVSSYRFWSPAWVLRQIDSLVLKYGVRNIKIADEMFVLNHKHVTAICDGLIERDYSLNLWAYARVDTAKDPALLNKLKKAGFHWLVLGIEAANPETRKDVDKNFKQQDIFDSVRRVQASGISVLANYIFGLPEDDLESLQETLDLALELNTEFANFYCAMAYPGSALYSRALKEHWELPAEWSAYSQHAKDTLPIKPRRMPAADVLKFRDRAFHAYFNRPGYRLMMADKFSPDVLKTIEEMTSHPLERLPR